MDFKDLNTKTKTSITERRCDVIFSTSAKEAGEKNVQVSSKRSGSCLGGVVTVSSL